MPAKRKILFVNRRGPYGAIYAQEALEIALIGAAFDQEISMAFLDDGVFLLRRDQNPSGLQMKQFTAAYRALGDFEIDRVYVERDSLRARGMASEDLVQITVDGGARSLVKLVSSTELSDIIESQEILLNY